MLRPVTLNSESPESRSGHDLEFSGWVSTLEAVYARIWMNLSSAVHRPDHGWHWPALGTTDSDGVPQMRTVVLRATDRESASLVSFTDHRSRKCRQITETPVVTWLFRDASLRAQLRVLTRTRLHRDDQTADDHWNAATLQSRRSYLATLPSGVVSTDPTVNLPEHLRDRAPTQEEVVAGRHNFAVIHSKIESMEWLLLGQRGNLSARFHISGDGSVDGNWLTP